jgi:hypothetical protein
MIIIIRVLPLPVRKRMVETNESLQKRDEVHDIVLKKEKEKGRKKGRKKEKKRKMREKERRGNATILLPHLCFKVAPCSSYRESPELSLSYTSGNFSL